MSWDVALLGSDGCAVIVPAHFEGGTYALDGSDLACLNVTYNYGEVFDLVGPWCGRTGFVEILNGEVAGRVRGWLALGVERLGVRRWASDYWAPTLGNAGYALSLLLGWTDLCPNGIWEVV